MQTEDIPPVVLKFVQASLDKNIQAIGELLEDNGEYNYQDENHNNHDGSKSDFLEWYGKRLSTTNIEKVEYDKCNKCIVGNLVVLFNEGRFPRIIKREAECSKTGLLLKSNNEKISIIAFCYRFQYTKNKFAFECVNDLTKKYLSESQSFEEALIKAEREFNLLNK